MPLEQLPTVKIDAFGAELKMPGEVPDGADKPTIVCRKKPKSEDLKCPDTIKTSKFKLVLKSPLRVRVSLFSTWFLSDRPRISSISIAEQAGVDWGKTDRPMGQRHDCRDRAPVQRSNAGDPRLV
jgi:hypothetical protein